MQRGKRAGYMAAGAGAPLMHHHDLINAPSGQVWQRRDDALWERDDGGSARVACRLGPAVGTPSGLKV